MEAYCFSKDKAFPNLRYHVLHNTQACLAAKIYTTIERNF